MSSSLDTLKYLWRTTQKTLRASRRRDARPEPVIAPQALFTPTAALAALFALGVLGIPLPQYLKWADRSGLFRSPYSVGLAQYGMRESPIPERLRIQHIRSFPPAVVAARTGHFDGIRHLVDIRGNTGVFAIPLVHDHLRMRITIVELPRSLPTIPWYQRAAAEPGELLRAAGFVDMQVTPTNGDFFSVTARKPSA